MRLFALAQFIPTTSTLMETQGFYSPTESLLVVAVDLARLLELGDELADGLGIILGVEVNNESVDHVCGLSVVWYG